MTDWLRNLDEPLTPAHRRLVEGLADLLDELQLPGLDPASCSVSVDDAGLHIALAHRTLGNIVDIDDVGEVMVGYGRSSDRWAWEYAETRRLGDGEAVATALAFLRRLLAGEVELQVRRRPWGVSTRSSWVAPDGTLERFLRGGTVRPYAQWQTELEVLRFDFTKL